MEDTAVEMWNEMAKETGLSEVQVFNAKRRKSVKARLKECGGLDGWQHAIDKVANTPWMLGKVNGRRLMFDTFIRPSFFTNLMEGAYDQSRASASIRSNTNRSGFDADLEAIKSFGSI